MQLKRLMFFYDLYVFLPTINASHKNSAHVVQISCILLNKRQ